MDIDNQEVIYCSVCDKFINHKLKQEHIKSKAHLYMYYKICNR